ncbi:MAG: hypothetical protein KGM15_07355 [Pseudomonadota bacterium]|nr:hypothetical protein [Pseudomonadota bacterium]
MRLTALFAAALVAATAARAAEPAYLFDALRLTKYKLSWTRLMKEVEPTPDWLLHFNTFDGAAGEMRPITIEGKPAMLSYVCKPEDCAGHKFEVLFDSDGARAFGALGGKDEPPAFFGKPSPGQQEALAQALRPAAPVAKDAVQPKSEATPKSE